MSDYPSLEQAKLIHGQRYPQACSLRLEGPRFVVEYACAGYPDSLMALEDPPERLYGVGNVEALRDGLAVIGARKATPYGRAAARRFAGLAAHHGIPIVSGGALGCDTHAHEGALEAEGQTVAVLGGGCDQLYPKRNAALFQRIVDGGGAVISERQWDYPPLPFTFRARNRIIAGLSRVTLIVEAGLPSGTFSTADDALSAGREVWAVPGPITSETSRGSNRLIYQGAAPVVDEETFGDMLAGTFGCLRFSEPAQRQMAARAAGDDLLAALLADPLHIEEMLALPWGADTDVPADKKLTWLMVRLAGYERDGLIVRFPDGRYGPARL